MQSSIQIREGWSVALQSMPVIVDLNKKELDKFIEAMDPLELFLWVATESEAEEEYPLKKIAQWH